MTKPRAIVPCQGCRLCCISNLVILHPEDGDVVESYAAHEVVNPLDGKKRYALDHKPSGDCVYLGDDGCTIWERAPVICKEFDCRAMFRRFSRNERRLMVKRGMVSTDILEAGRQRLHTLDKNEKSPGPTGPGQVGEEPALGSKGAGRLP